MNLEPRCRDPLAELASLGTLRTRTTPDPYPDAETYEDARDDYGDLT